MTRTCDINFLNSAILGKDVLKLPLIGLRWCIAQDKERVRKHKGQSEHKEGRGLAARKVRMRNRRNRRNKEGEYVRKMQDTTDYG